MRVIVSKNIRHIDIKASDRIPQDVTFLMPILQHCQFCLNCKILTVRAESLKHVSFFYISFVTSGSTRTYATNSVASVP